MHPTVVRERFWPYGSLRAFWISRSEEGNVLHFLPNRKYALVLTLQLGKADVEKVRAILSDRLVEEEDRGEDMVDRIGRFFRL